MGLIIRIKCSQKSDEIVLQDPASKEYSWESCKFGAQCHACFKWRIIATEEEYEKLRSKWSDDPFFCTNKPNVSCDDPSDIENAESKVWALDTPDVPKTPAGFKRQYVLKEEQSEVYYVAPNGKKLKTLAKVTSFLNKNPTRFGDLSVSDFSFAGPVMQSPRLPPIRRRRSARRPRKQG